MNSRSTETLDAERAVDIGTELSKWRREQPGTAAASAAAIDLLNAAEQHLAPGIADDTDSTIWYDYLYSTGAPDFLEYLPDRESRVRWANLAFRAIERSGYSLVTMLQQRVAAHPERTLFRDARETNQHSTYAQVAWYTRALAGVFLQSLPMEPRVAILCDNSIDSACADLACLLYGIVVSPLNVHFNAETVEMCRQNETGGRYSIAGAPGKNALTIDNTSSTPAAPTSTEARFLRKQWLRRPKLPCVV